jgi:nuclear GTP-binding protein
MSSARRNKNERNAREKNRVARKAAKADPRAHSRKIKKDPGIPNLYPFKEKLLNQIQDAKNAQEEQKKSDKARLKQMLASAKVSFGDY